MSRTYNSRDDQGRGHMLAKRALKHAASKKMRRQSKVAMVYIYHSAEVTALTNRAEYFNKEAEKLLAKAARLAEMASNLKEQECSFVLEPVFKHSLDWEL